jgi:hypothetical protein
VFDELEKYKNNDHFFFERDDLLRNVCNTPQNICGVYIVNSLRKGKIEIVNIGSSGKIYKDGKIKYPDGGLYDAIVNESQFGEPRNISWPLKMVNDEIDALDIYWYETLNSEISDLPSYTEAIILQKYFEIYGTIPKWNKPF